MLLTPAKSVTGVRQTRTRGNVPMIITLLSHTQERRVSRTEHSDSLNPTEERQDVAGPGLSWVQRSHRSGQTSGDSGARGARMPEVGRGVLARRVEWARCHCRQNEHEEYVKRRSGRNGRAAPLEKGRTFERRRRNQK